MRDQYHQHAYRQALAAATYTADQAGDVIDRLGYGAVTFALAIGAGGITFSGSNKIEFKLEASEDNSVWAAVQADEVVGVSVTGSGLVKSLIAAHASADVTGFGYIGDARYLRLTADFSGTHGTGTPLGCTAILGRGQNMPPA